ncbi:hypothetical protein KC19_3G087000 [Ceratodon purpureus]|uniref:Uncharacterized protein n=1 Tax=Ceratodon purpureus TaxID=3225 RepID=A0A8T0IGE8_CERPU|nr:hypothetical protein KC19_3G087000 [Ceratodon purpureus]
MVTFEGFEPVFGAGLGQLDSPTGHDALLSSLSYLGASDSDHPEMHATDFRASTWFADMSTEFLEDLKDDLGIVGSWEEFVQCVRAMFVSDHVGIIYLKGTLISAMINEGIYFLLHWLQDHELPPLQLRPKLRLQQLQHRHFLLQHLLLPHLRHEHPLLVFSRQSAAPDTSEFLRP